MVKETRYVAVLAEEQGFDTVLKKPYVFEKLEELNTSFYYSG